MKVLVVYCHPSENSFTYQVKTSFVRGLEDAGHSVIVSDLYKDGFDPVMSEEEYLREGFYDLEKPIPDDVKKEQDKVNAADVIVFIYPDFWTAAPAVLEGWFQRVWTYGFAYGDDPEIKMMEKALFLITMGGSIQEEIRQRELDAMKTIMIGDRMKGRAKNCEVHVFDDMRRGYGNDENRANRIKEFSTAAYDLARAL